MDPCKKKMKIGKGSVKSKSMRNKYHKFNLKNPIREALNVYKVI